MRACLLATHKRRPFCTRRNSAAPLPVLPRCLFALFVGVMGSGAGCETTVIRRVTLRCTFLLFLLLTSTRTKWGGDFLVFFINKMFCFRSYFVLFSVSHCVTQDEGGMFFRYKRHPLHQTKAPVSQALLAHIVFVERSTAFGPDNKNSSSAHNVLTSSFLQHLNPVPQQQQWAHLAQCWRFSDPWQFST